MSGCKICNGSGRLVLFRSWFTSDGYRFGKCGHCGGSGKTSQQASSGLIAEQRRIREMFGVVSSPKEANDAL